MLQNEQKIPSFINHEEFAKIIGKSSRTVYNILTSNRVSDTHRKAGLPPFRKICGRYVVEIDDFKIWLNQQPVLNPQQKQK